MRDGSTVLARIRLPRFFKTDADAEGFGGAWEFIPVGFFGNTIEIREKGHELPFAKWEKKAFKADSTISLPKGERLTVQFSMWKGTTRVLTQDNREIFLRTTKISFKKSCDIVPGVAWNTLERMPWLLLLIEHDAILRRRQAAVGAGS
jgi:hypothetical protein